MNAYNFDPATGEYMGQTAMHLSPLDEEEGRTVYLLPANATDLAPPPPGGKQAAVYRDGAWSIVPDHRGEIWWLKRGQCVTIAELGTEPDPAWTETEPQPTLDELRTSKRLAIQGEKVRVRDGGVVVDGVRFDTDPSAMSAYTRAMVFLFSANPQAEINDWKASDGVWVKMTMGLMQQLIAAGSAQEQAVFAWQAQQEAALAAATTLAEVEAISTTYA